MTLEEKQEVRKRWRAIVKNSSPIPPSGVYAIFSGQSLLYVGMSLFMPSRLSLHTYRDTFVKMNVTRIATRKILDPHLCFAVEKFLIWTLKPPLNKQISRSESIGKEYRCMRNWNFQNLL